MKSRLKRVAFFVIKKIDRFKQILKIFSLFCFLNKMAFCIKTRLLFVLLFLLTNVVNAQVFTVLDKTTYHSLPEVSITNIRTNSFLKTNLKGEVYLFENRLNDTIKLDLLGYQSSYFTFQQIKDLKFKVYLTEQRISINEIIVSASKFEENKSDVPLQIAVVKAKEIAFLNQSTTADLLQQTGNIQVQKSQAGGGSPVIRGFEANKVLLVIDGVRMNNAIYRSGHLQNVITIDQSLLDKVEIVFGPGSVVYGSDALGGMVHFYTKKPSLSIDENMLFKINANSRYATAAKENTQHFNLNFGFKKIAFLSSFTYSNFGDLKQGANRSSAYPDFGKRPFYQDNRNGKDTMIRNSDVDIQKLTGYQQYDFSQKLLFKPSSNVKHELNFQYSTSSNINRYDRLTEFAGAVLRYGEWYYGPQNRLLTAYHFNLKTNKKLVEEVRITASYQAIEESRISRQFGNNNLDSRIENVNVLALNADAGSVIKNHEIRYGLEANYNDVQSKANRKNILSGVVTNLDTRYPDGGSNMYSVAFYATHSWEISPKFILSDGLRYSQINLSANFDDKTFFPFPYDKVKQKASALSGNIGFSYLPGADWKIAYVVSSGFRAPNVDDLGKVFESVAGNIILPNPNLKPEYTYNTEFNVSKIFADKVSIEAGAYYTWYRNAITVQNATFNGQSSIFYDGQISKVSTSINASKAFIYGLHGQFNAKISSSLNLNSTINYTYGRIKGPTSKNPLDHISPLFGQTGLQLQIKKFRADFFAQYNGWKKLKDYSLSGEDNLQYATIDGMPSWCVFNLRTAYQLSKKIQLQAALENISDQNYRMFASGISSAGRNLVLSVRGSF